MRFPNRERQISFSNSLTVWVWKMEAQREKVAVILQFIHGRAETRTSDPRSGSLPLCHISFLHKLIFKLVRVIF